MERNYVNGTAVIIAVETYKNAKGEKEIKVVFDDYRRLSDKQKKFLADLGITHHVKGGKKWAALADGGWGMIGYYKPYKHGKYSKKAYDILKSLVVKVKTVEEEVDLNVAPF